MESANEMKLIFESRSINESFARVTVAAFMTSLNPTVEEVSDVKTAVSEAVTNAIIHGYEGEVHSICIRCRIEGKTLYVEVEDEGKGIEDVKQAMEPLFTTKPEQDRSGMGFSFMEAFMDELEVISKPHVFMICMAFTNYSKLGNHLMLFDWVGLENFKALFDSSSILGSTFWSVLGWTLVWAF